MIKWFQDRDHRKALAILLGFIPNFLALYFIDSKLFAFILEHPLMLLTIIALFGVIMGLVKEVGKLLSKLVFITSLGTIFALIVKVLFTFLTEQGYFEW